MSTYVFCLSVFPRITAIAPQACRGDKPAALTATATATVTRFSLLSVFLGVSRCLSLSLFSLPRALSLFLSVTRALTYLLSLSLSLSTCVSRVHSFALDSPSSPSPRPSPSSSINSHTLAASLLLCFSWPRPPIGRPHRPVQSYPHCPLRVPSSLASLTALAAHRQASMQRSPATRKKQAFPLVPTSLSHPSDLHPSSQSAPQRPLVESAHPHALNDIASSKLFSYPERSGHCYIGTPALQSTVFSPFRLGPLCT